MPYFFACQNASKTITRLIVAAFPSVQCAQKENSNYTLPTIKLTFFVAKDKL